MTKNLKMDTTSTWQNNFKEIHTNSMGISRALSYNY